MTILYTSVEAVSVADERRFFLGQEGFHGSRVVGGGAEAFLRGGFPIENVGQPGACVDGDEVLDRAEGRGRSVGELSGQGGGLLGDLLVDNDAVHQPPRLGG